MPFELSLIRGIHIYLYSTATLNSRKLQPLVPIWNQSDPEIESLFIKYGSLLHKKANSINIRYFVFLSTEWSHLWQTKPLLFAVLRLLATFCSSTILQMFCFWHIHKLHTWNITIWTILLSPPKPIYNTLFFITETLIFSILTVEKHKFLYETETLISLQ